MKDQWKFQAFIFNSSLDLKTFSVQTLAQLSMFEKIFKYLLYEAKIFQLSLYMFKHWTITSSCNSEILEQKMLSEFADLRWNGPHD